MRKKFLLMPLLVGLLLVGCNNSSTTDPTNGSVDPGTSVAPSVEDSEEMPTSTAPTTTADPIEVTPEDLGVTGVKYDDSNFTGSTAKVYEGTSYGMSGVGEYGDGFQWRLKSASALWNETGYTYAIASITLNFNPGKNYPGSLGLFTSKTGALTTPQTTGEKVLGNGSTEYTVSATFTAADDIHFFRLQYRLADYTFSSYLSSFAVTFHA